MQNIGTLAVVLVLACAMSAAQKPANTGTISGRVTCADTNLPARLARVVVRPAPSAKSASSSTERIEAQSVQTLLDGTFTVSGLAPGTYMVLATMPGYIGPLSALGISNDQLFDPSDELRKRILQDVPTVNLDSAASASINVSLERAAAVSGTVLYDDGSPAVGLHVHLLHRVKGKWDDIRNGAGDGMWSGNSTTDDRGNYRVVGLLPQKEAIVQVDLSVQSSRLQFGKNSLGSSSGQWPQIAFYSGNALRTADAKPFPLTAGEERSGEDITLPLSKLHKVEGILEAKKDGHVLNGGSVTLLFADDGSLLGSTTLTKDEDGFKFPFVPEGEYILRVNAAADVRLDEVANPPGFVPATRTESTILRTYGPAEMRLHVDADRLNVVVELPDQRRSEKDLAQQWDWRLRIGARIHLQMLAASVRI